MWLAWHLIASTSHTPKFLPFVCKHYIFSQGHIGEGQWEGREGRGDLLMHWPFQKGNCSPQEQSSLWTIPYSYGQSWEGELSYPTAATGWAVISSGMYLGVLWPRKFWEHPWITNGVTQRPQGLWSWLAPKKILPRGSGTTNNNTGLPVPDKAWILKKRPRQAKRKRAQSLHSEVVEYKMQEKWVILN